MVKNAIFFSIDALIASALILAVILLVPSFFSQNELETQELYLSSDIIQILSNIRLEEINSTAVMDLLNSSRVRDLNRTILEQVLRFQVEGNEDKATRLINLTVAGLVPSQYEMGIWIEGYSDPIYITNSTPVTKLISSKQMVSGIEKGKALEGLASRVFLSNINERASSSFAYFGGYEGDGNITKFIFLPESITNITNGYLELDVLSDFDLYINGNFSGTFNASGSYMRADSWKLNSTYLKNFREGQNTIKLSFTQPEKYVGGGYFRVDYSTEEISTYEEDGHGLYNFPGIDGIINLYSSIYIPGTLNAMSIHLHTDSKYEVFLGIGDRVVYNYNLSGEVNLPDDELKLALDYNSLSNKTVPIRMGHMVQNLTGVIGDEFDIVLITDLSASMFWRLDVNTTGVTRNCSDPNLYDSSTDRLSLAKCLDKEFVKKVLENTNNRVSLAAFYGDSGDPWKGRVYSESFTDDINYLQGKIEEYQPQGGTCICCAINTAYNMLNLDSNPARKKYIIVMSDGVPTHDCEPGVFKQGNDVETKCDGIDTIGESNGQAGCFGDRPEDCDSVNCQCAAYNANFSSCRVHNDFDAIVHSIGFGPITECDTANKTLRHIADCGEGDYYASDNATVLRDAYTTIYSKILNISYKKQAVLGAENLSPSILYPDSYIEFNYTPPLAAKEYGKVPLIIESPPLGNNITQGTFFVPEESSVYDAKITSYSSDLWTHRGLVGAGGGWISFYNLTQYGSDYQVLGDPYILNIPVSLIKKGENLVEIGTASSPVNLSGGSPDDRVIYTLGITMDVNNTGIFDKATGCIWQVSFEDGTGIEITLPSNYEYSHTCLFDNNTNCDEDYNDDAINNAVCHLFNQLDFDNDGKLFVKFGEEDLDLEIFTVGGRIPYMWGPTIVEARVWK
jgi:hypothetical protein